MTLKHDDAHILIVDDEPANLKLLEKLLGSEGYFRLTCVQDPRQVLRAYREARPDLILLDINMPHLDGYQVMEQLKALNDPLLPPIVVLTAEHGRDRLLRALAAGARDFVGKPFDRSELLMRIRNLLDLQRHHFARAQPGTVGDRQRGLVLQVDPVQIIHVGELLSIYRISY